MNLLRVEMDRALRRRAVRVLVATALLGCVVAGVIAFLSSRGMTVAELSLDGEGHPAVMTDWWSDDDGDGFLAVGAFFLALGGLFGGATVAGGEWRAGTVTTVLTWEPRRLRLHCARTASAAILAFLIACGLQLVFLASFLPAVLAHGTSAGADAGFWADLGLAVVRTSVITAMAAVLAVALATAARNTAFAVIVVFTWLAVIENLARALKPSAAPWLWAENVGTVVSWNRLPDVEVTHGPLAALATLLAYVVIVAVLAGLSFQHRDVVAAA